jgi:hypothetical protein
MSNPVGRPQNDFEVKRVTVPKELVPEVKNNGNWRTANEHYHL